MPASGPFRVGEWTAEPDLDRLARGDERVPLRPQVMRLLVYLAERAGDVVHSEDLMRDLWSGKIVSDATLYNCVAELRNVLDRDRESASAIQTVPKKGYRLKLPVSGIGEAEPPDSSEPGPQGALPAKPLYVPRWMWFGAVAATVAVSVVFFVGRDSTGPDHSQPAPIARSEPTRNSIAVLPFRNLSSDPDGEYLSDGVAIQILSALSRVDGLAVIASTSSFTFKSADASIRDIGNLLGARYVMDGAVFRSGDRVRITAQLVDANTGVNVWSESYDRTTGDLISIQDDIARAIMAELTDRLLDRPPRTVSEPVGFDAYDLYLVALEQRRNARTDDQVLAVAVLLDRVLEIEPDFVEALTLRAVVEIDLSDYPFGIRTYTREEALPRAKQWIDAAREQANDAPEVLYALALYHDAQDEVPTAESYYREAVQARPNYTDARVNLARTLLRELRFDEAMAQLKAATEYDPANAAPNFMLFNTYLMMHELAKAEATLDRLERLTPDDPAITWNRAKHLLFAGRLAESLRLIERYQASGIDEDLAEEFARGKLSVLLGLAEYDRVIDASGRLDRAKGLRIDALILDGRHREAVAAAERWLAEAPDSAWPADALLKSLFYAGRWSDYVSVFERNFDHASLFRDLVYLPVDSMALGPYQAVGHRRSEWFERVARGGVENAEEGGAAWGQADVYAARLLVLDGREDEAVSRLQRAVEKKFFSPWIPVDPLLAQLDHRQDYAALIETIERRVNEQRSELDLTPVELTKAVSTIQVPPGGS